MLENSTLWPKHVWIATWHDRGNLDLAKIRKVARSHLVGADTLFKKFFWYLVFAQVGNLQGIIGIKTWWFYLDDGVGCPSSSVFLYGMPYYIYFYHDLSAGSVREILYLVQLILWYTAVQCRSRRAA